MFLYGHKGNLLQTPKKTTYPLHKCHIMNYSLKQYNIFYVYFLFKTFSTHF